MPLMQLRVKAEFSNLYFVLGHEYAEDNLLFAAEVEPGNVACEQKLQWVLQRRGQRLCTVSETSADYFALFLFYALNK